LADHIRTIAFTIADGQLPSNNGAGYVIRRILRRAVRYYYSYLDYKQPLLFQLMPLLAKQFEQVFPELNAQLDFVTRVTKEEEEGFLRTLEKGIKKFEDIVDPSIKHLFTDGEPGALVREKIIDGVSAFVLFDTYGFPIDLTQLMATEIGWTVDMKGFEEALQQQKNRSRAASVVDTEDWVTVNDIASSFVGYDSLETKTQVVKYRKVKAKGKEGYQIVLAETPFYAESGGQVGDKGQLQVAGCQLLVSDTKKENNLIIHFVETLPADIDMAAEVIATVDTSKRQDTSSNHSATHLLHAALRQVLGTHVAQKGSLVNDEQLRFDFSHFSKVTDEEIAQIEAIVNQKIRENVPVVIKEMSKDEAVALGAMALFGEKYGDVVRVVVMDPNYSIELCGGTHVGYTRELGYFKIKSESAVAAGVRRIEAVSGKAAAAYIEEAFSTIEAIKGLFNNPKELLRVIENSVADNKELKKKIESLEAKQLVAIKAELLTQLETVNGHSFIGAVLDLSNADGLKKLAGELVASFLPLGGGGAVVLAANIGGKASVAIAISEALVAKGIEAPKLIKEHITPIIKGGGGGQKTLATAGGTDASNLDKVIDVVKGLL
jgi:alanyl-tRNA synthetase